MPQVGELMNSKHSLAKKNKIWLWVAVDYFQTGSLAWVVGRRDSKTFEPL